MRKKSEDSLDELVMSVDFNYSNTVILKCDG